MVLSVRRRIAGIARAEPDRTALVGFGADLAEQVLSWREFANRVADAADALSAATGASTGIPKMSARPGPLRYNPVRTPSVVIRLAGYKIPKHFTFTNQVPRSAASKIQRWRLAPYHENGASPP